MVVRHFDKGLYFGLNVNLASAQQPRKVQEICDAILREHEVSNEQCERELLTLLGGNSPKNGLLQFAMRRLHKIAGRSQEPEGFWDSRGPRREVL